VERLLGLLLGLYRSGQADAIYAVYTEFHSPIRRRPRTVRFLPVRLPGADADEEPGGDVRAWHYEPGLRGMIEELVAVYLRVQLHEVLLASYASEQGARMITMEEATERADKALQEYRVRHNRLRREAITTDLLGTLVASPTAGEAAPAVRT
jgi:F-type H+-transporting ATPase subunit gamma